MLARQSLPEAQEQFRNLVTDHFRTVEPCHLLAYTDSAIHYLSSRRHEFMETADLWGQILPDKALILIMAQLGAKGVHEVACVNRRWARLSKCEELWELLYKQRWGYRSGGRRQIYLGEFGDTFRERYLSRLRLHRNWTEGLYYVSVLRSHPGDTFCVEFDTKEIVTSTLDTNVQVCDLYTGKVRHVMQGHRGVVNALNFNDKLIATASHDKTIKVWNRATGVCRLTFKVKSSTVLCLEFFKSYLLAGCGDGSLLSYSTSSGKLVSTFRGHEKPILQVIATESFLATASLDGTIRLWDLVEGVPLRTLSGHTSAVTCLQADEQTLVSGSQDNTLRLWIVGTGKTDFVMEGHEGIVSCVQFDARIVVSGSHDGTIRLWDVETGTPLHTLELPGRARRVQALQFDAMKIIAGYHDRSVWHFDFTAETEFATRKPAEARKPLRARKPTRKTQSGKGQRPATAGATMGTTQGRKTSRKEGSLENSGNVVWNATLYEKTMQKALFAERGRRRRCFNPACRRRETLDDRFCTCSKGRHCQAVYCSKECVQAHWRDKDEPHRKQCPSIVAPAPPSPAHKRF